MWYYAWVKYQTHEDVAREKLFLLTRLLASSEYGSTAFPSTLEGGEYEFNNEELSICVNTMLFQLTACDFCNRIFIWILHAWW